MKDWLPASSVAELRHLFTPTPPPVTVKPPAVKPPAPKQASSPSTAINRNKILIASGAGLLLVIIIASIFIFRGKKPHEEIAIGKLDSAVNIPRADTVAKKESTAADTTNIINVDSLASTIWDTTSNINTTARDSTPSFLPGFGTTASAAPDTKKPKSPGPKKTNKKRSEEQANDTRDESVTPRRTEAEKVNPARYISVTGTFRKNLVFEAILEGTIRNGYSSQVRDVTIEVTFLDGSGQSLGSKRFTQNGTVPAGASMSFKFKTKPPKGAKTARYEVASASLR
jgi:hypothetical protein